MQDIPVVINTSSRGVYLRIFILIALILIVVLKVIKFFNTNEFRATKIPLEGDSSANLQDSYVEISGAVLNPGIYKVTSGSRLYSVIKDAGGISSSADPEFVLNELNMARVLTDGEKIIIKPNNMTKYVSDKLIDVVSYYDNSHNTSENSAIRLNKMTYNDLISLSGIGDVYANKILNYTPYNSFEDLIERSGVPKKILENLRNELGF